MHLKKSWVSSENLSTMKYIVMEMFLLSNILKRKFTNNQGEEEAEFNYDKYLESFILLPKDQKF